MRRVATAALVASALAGCANPGIVPVSGDVYMLSRMDRGGIFGNAAAMKADVIREASEFAAQRGKIAIPLHMREQPMLPGRFASVEYQFQLVERNDPRVQGASLAPRPDMVIERSDKVSVDARTRDATERPKDTYAELLRLDDLRKRGILTDAEFEAQKKKLLGQ